MPEAIQVSMTTEVKEAFDKIGQTVADLRAKNDELLSQRNQDGITKEEVKRINDAIDVQQKQVEALTKAVARTDKGSDGDKASVATEAQKQYSDAFRRYLAKGVDANLAELHQKAMSVNSDPDGGYTVTPEMASTISKVIQEFSPVRGVASVQVIGSDSLDVLADTDLLTSGWVGETATRSDTATAQIKQINIQAHEMYAQPKATQKLLDDSNINIEQWIAQKAAETFAVLEGTAFVSGDGASKPRGFLTYTAGTSYGQVQQIANGHATVLAADSILKLFYGVKEAYARNAAFMMKRSTIQEVRLLKESTTNAYLWQPGLAAGQPDTLVGRPVVEATDIPAVGSATIPIAFADWRSFYQIVDRIGIRTLRDPFTDKPFVKFYTTKRVGGGVVNFEAGKLLIMST